MVEFCARTMAVAKACLVFFSITASAHFGMQKGKFLLKRAEKA